MFIAIKQALVGAILTVGSLLGIYGVGSQMIGANPLPSDNYDSFLTSPLSASATTTYVNALPSGVSSSIYTIFATDGTTPREKLYCTGTATSPNRLTYCTRGISFNPVSGVIDETAGTGLSHSKNARVAITDNINFSGKALSILNGSQPTNADSFYVGTATSTAIWLNDTGNKVCFGSSDYCIRSSGSDLQWSINGFTDSYSFTSSSFTVLTASSTKGIGVTDSKVHINASSTTGMTFDTSGYLYQKTSSTKGIASDSNGIYLDTTQDRTWTGAHTFSATTTMATTTLTSTTVSTLIIGATSTAALIDGSNANDYHVHYYSATTSAVITTTTVQGNYNVDTTFDCGFVPHMVQINYTLHGDPSAGDTYSVGTATYNQTTLKNNFWLFKNIESAAFAATSPIIDAVAPYAGAQGGVGDIVVSLSVDSISGTSVVVRLSILQEGGGAGVAETYSINCYR